MDHIPKPTDPWLELPAIPHLKVSEKLKYDGKGVKEFPQRTGFDPQKLHAGDLCGHTRLQTLGFLQQWAFFGILQEYMNICGVRFDPSDFVIEEGEEGKEQISTSLLLYYLRLCEGNASSLSAEERVNAAYRIDLGIRPVILAVIQLAQMAEQFYHMSSLWAQRVYRNALLTDSTTFSKLDPSVQAQRLYHNSYSSDPPPPRELGWLGNPSAYTCNEDSLGQFILLSIVVLIDTLSDSKKICFGFPLPRCPTPILLKNLALKAGWCPREELVLEEAVCDNVEHLYLAQIDRSRLEKNHSECGSGIKLENIIGKELEPCLADQVNPETYVTQHAQSECQCELITPDGWEVDKIARILEAGDIPLVIGNAPNSAECNAFSIVSSADVDYYIAISHVWSDGLGNPRSNQLPLCQLKRLQYLVNDTKTIDTFDTDAYEDLNESNQRRAEKMADMLYNPAQERIIPFWIDTICVPLDEELRWTAIKSMNRVYRQAGKVLTLDSTLNDINIFSNQEELMLRLKYSTWAQRLWTFNEGAAAQSIAFQFGDRAVSSQFIEARMSFDPRTTWRFKSSEQLHQSGASRAICKQWRNFTTKWSRRGGFQDDKLFPSEQSIAPRASPFFKLFMSGYDFFNTIRSEFHDPTTLDRHVYDALFNSLKFRSTSRRSDECICIYQLLKLNIEELEGKTESQRMATLLSNFTEVPMWVLFARLQRLTDAGCSWMPCTFLRNDMQVRYSHTMADAAAKLTDDGSGALDVKLPSARLIPCEGKSWSGNSIDVVDCRGLTLKISLDCLNWSSFSSDTSLRLVLEDLQGLDDLRTDWRGALVQAVESHSEFTTSKLRETVSVRPLRDTTLTLETVSGKLDEYVDQHWRII